MASTFATLALVIVALSSCGAPAATERPAETPVQEASDDPVENAPSGADERWAALAQLRPGMRPDGARVASTLAELREWLDTHATEHACVGELAWVADEAGVLDATCDATLSSGDRARLVLRRFEIPDVDPEPRLLHVQLRPPSGASPDAWAQSVRDELDQRHGQGRSHGIQSVALTLWRVTPRCGGVCPITNLALVLPIFDPTRGPRCEGAGCREPEVWIMGEEDPNLQRFGFLLSDGSPAF